VEHPQDLLRILGLRRMPIRHRRHDPKVDWISQESILRLLYLQLQRKRSSRLKRFFKQGQ
jgi:hypothetical protein